MGRIGLRFGSAAVLALGGLAACGSELDSADAPADGAPSYQSGVPDSPVGAARGGSGGAIAASGGSSPIYGPDQEDPTGSSGGASGDEEVPTEPPKTNPFVVTAHDPLSTFAADVDTASYDIFRRDVNLGVLPQADTVRLEDYVNNFKYAYEAPAEDAPHPFNITLAAAPSLFAYDTTILRIGIQGMLPPPEEKKPTNLVFLVDVSGSMASSEKLPLVKQVLTETLDILAPTDTVSIVTYAGSTEVLLQPTVVAEQAQIEAVIANLASGGSTAGAAGIDLAYEQAQAGFIDGGINHVVLCTDGDFNVGPYTTTELVDLIVEKRKTGITLTALGFGTGNLNDSMMEAVSNAGNGMYGMISNSEQASEYVSERMLSTLVHIAKDMKIQVEFNPEHVYAYRLLGYENRAIADNDFRNDVVDAGEVGAGHRVTALYEIVRSGSAIPSIDGAPTAEDGSAYTGAVEVGAEDFVLVKVRYKQPGAAESDPALEVASSLPPTQIAQSHTERDIDFQWALALASFAEILKDSPYADPERLPQIEDIVEASVHAASPDRAEFVGLFEKAKPLLLVP